MKQLRIVSWVLWGHWHRRFGFRLRESKEFGDKAFTVQRLNESKQLGRSDRIRRSTFTVKLDPPYVSSLRLEDATSRFDKMGAPVTNLVGWNFYRLLRS